MRKELKHFEDRYSQFAPAQQNPLAFLQEMYAAIQPSDEHLVQVRRSPKLLPDNTTYVVELQPVGLAYRNTLLPDEQEAKLAVKGALSGCQELHAHGGSSIVGLL